MQVRTASQQLGLTAQARRADNAALGQIVEAGKGVGDESITRIFALANTEQTQTFREVHRHVFHGVHGDVSFVFEQSGFQLLDEQTLATDFRQRRVQQLVATADHGHQRHHKTWVSLF